MNDIGNIKKIAVIGAGTMGHEIAQVALMGGFSKVVLNDLNSNILQASTLKIQQNLHKLESKGLLRANITVESLMENLIQEPDLKSATKDADFVIEAIPEVMELKKDLFKKLGEVTPPHAILASNTSTMSITEIAIESGRPDKVVGMHFFTPIVLLRLIELIKGENTSEETFNLAEDVGKQLPALKGKRFIAKIVKESPGFIVNRLTICCSIFLSWLLDYAKENHIPIEQIDNDFVSPPQLGPFAKWDYLGLDVVCDSMNYLAKTISPVFKPGKTLSNLLKKGNLGRKTGQGIYKWSENKPEISSAKKAGLYSLEHYYAILLNEGCRLLEEKVVSGYRTIDNAMLAGMDMPGPFSVGKRKHAEWCGKLEEIVAKSGIEYLKPSNLMKTGKFLDMK